MLSMFSCACLSALLLAGHASAVAQDVVDWREREQFNIGYRTHAPPFAYDAPSTRPEDGEKLVPTGYSVDICRRIEAMLVERYPGIRVEWRGVKSSDRLDKLKSGDIDLLCGTTTVALNRLTEFESSLFSS
jgi:polar amino acid transport system substrate-binding protein/glutamate/aspartate transport system substrate-binding protein